MILNSRKTWSGLAAALPLALLSAQFAYVLFAPSATANRDWVEDAGVLVRIECVMIFAAALTCWVRSYASSSRRAVATAAVALLFGLPMYLLWRGTDGSAIVAGAALLLAGRFASALVAGTEAGTELFERATVGAVFYGIVLGLVYLVEPGLPERYQFITHPAVVFCALHYFLLAFVEVGGIFARWEEPEIRHPVVVLKPGAPGYHSIRLIFDGDAIDIMHDVRLRPAMRIFLFLTGSAWFSGWLAGFLFPPDAVFRFVAIVNMVLGVSIIVFSLHRGADWKHVKIRRGEITLREISRGRLRKSRVVIYPEIERIEISIDKKSRYWSLFGKVRGQWLPMELLSCIWDAWDDRWAAPLLHLLELYFSGDSSPQGLRAALAADRELAEILGADVVAQLLAPQPVNQ